MYNTANYSVGTGNGGGSGQTVTASVGLDCPLKVSAAWVPSGTLAADPQPAVLRLSESGSATWNATSSGSASIAGLAAAPAQYPSTSFPGLKHTVTAKATSTVVVPNNGYGSAAASANLTYTVNALPISGTLSVDQDQQVLAPAATTRFSATVSNTSGFTIDWIKISVDGGTATLATIPAGSSSGYIDWPSASAGSPSEHTVTATAQIHDSVGSLLLNSKDLPSRQYATSGMS